jgi:hypothetical protein
MGACDYSVLWYGKADDVNDAFRQAVKEAKYEHGHGGYTGSIAEKHSVKLLTPPCEYGTPEFNTWKNARIDADDKWGPALAVELTGDALKTLKARVAPKARKFKAYVFFGLASC